jgi:hypothetical protein
MPQKWFSLVFGDENRVERPLQTSEDELYGRDYFELKQGKRISNWNPKSALRSSSRKDDGDPDDILCEHLGIPTLSQRFRKALTDAGVGTNDIQFLPLKVFKSTGEEVKGFAVANVITRIAALDHKRSKMIEVDEEEIDPLTGKPNVLSVWTAALHQKQLAGHDMIRLLEFFPPVFVSERFAEVFQRGKFTGATLKPAIVTA